MRSGSGALEAENAKLKKPRRCWRRGRAKRCENSGERTGSTRAGALDDTARIVRTAGVALWQAALRYEPERQPLTSENTQRVGFLINLHR
jgi:hypothetical protein